MMVSHTLPRHLTIIWPAHVACWVRFSEVALYREIASIDVPFITNSEITSQTFVSQDEDLLYSRSL